MHLDILFQNSLIDCISPQTVIYSHRNGHKVLLWNVKKGQYSPIFHYTMCVLQHSLILRGFVNCANDIQVSKRVV
jgi:hypothetical protein